MTEAESRLNSLLQERQLLSDNLGRLDQFLTSGKYKEFNFTDKYIETLYEQRIHMKYYKETLDRRINLFEEGEVYLNE